MALEVAARHPALVRRLVFASAFTTREGAVPEFWDFMKDADFANVPQPLKHAFLRVNADAAQLRRMHDKDARRMQTFEDVPDDRIRSVRAPALVVLGDRDIVRVEHAAGLARLFHDARLLVLPGGHGDYPGEAVTTQRETPLPGITAALIDTFLNEGS